MDSFLVSEKLSEKTTENGEGAEVNNEASHPLFAYTTQFENICPYYMSIGMTYDEFWNGDCCLVKYYREAEKIRQDKLNQQLWLQGMYIYEAILDASPVLHSFAKKGTKPVPYASEPYPITAEQIQKKREKEEKARLDKGKRYIEMFMARQKLNTEGKESDGNGK